MKENNQSVKRVSAVPSNSRRAFIKNGAAMAAFAAVAPSVGISPFGSTARDNPENMINGIQVGAVSFVDEGVDNVLDIFQKRGAMNTVFLNTFSYGRGLAGRQIPGQPFPDHGSQKSDEKTFYGGNYATPHPEFYKDTVIKVQHAPDLGNIDILAQVIPAAKKRGMKVICCAEDVFRREVPGVEQCLEIDVMGRKGRALCLLNPNTQAFWRGLVTDYSKSYDIDGVLFFNERSGPLLNAIGASHFQAIEPSKVTCFCQYHQQAAKKLGIDFERVKEGYLKLDKFVVSSLKGQRPSDGYYVQFERLLIEYPEISAWEKLYVWSKYNVVNQVYDAIKGVNKNLLSGFHIEHVNSFNPYFRSEFDYANLTDHADFLKIVVYNNAGGERYASFIRNIGSTVFRDVPLEELMRFNNHLLNYSNEASLDQLATAGLSADYVFRETQRAIAGVKGKCKILPGIDIGIPTKAGSRKASPEDVYAATAAAYKAGADGCILSRKYSEMMLADLDAAGRAIRDTTKA